MEGARLLTNVEVEQVVYPFLGPGRPIEDIEKARAALEKYYSDRGYQAVSVAIPPQKVREGVVMLTVNEARVRRLRVNGAHHFLPSHIRRHAPSVREGAVPNFNDVAHDLVVLNQLPDRQVNIVPRAGEVPGTIDVDVNVRDSLPLHGSIELNNRSASSTTELRLNGSVRYDNLWQAGHSLSLTCQVAPQRLRDGLVVSGAYIARFPSIPWLSLIFNGVVQASDISTLSAIAVIGRGQIVGARAAFVLPGHTGFSHTLTAGLDWKHFDENISLGTDEIKTPVTYFPATAQYGAAWIGWGSKTLLNASVTFNLRNARDIEQFDAKRYNLYGNFLYLRGELARTETVAGRWELFGKLSGQFATEPLVTSEAFVSGGAESVRGYREATAAGDSGAGASLELRTPSLDRWSDGWINEWRFLAFIDWAWLSVRDPLPEQRASFTLESVGGGTRMRVTGNWNLALEAGVPLIAAGQTEKYGPRIHFKVGGEF